MAQLPFNLPGSELPEFNTIGQQQIPVGDLQYIITDLVQQLQALTDDVASLQNQLSAASSPTAPGQGIAGLTFLKTPALVLSANTVQSSFKTLDLSNFVPQGITAVVLGGSTNSSSDQQILTVATNIWTTGLVLSEAAAGAAITFFSMNQGVFPTTIPQIQYTADNFAHTNTGWSNYQIYVLGYYS